MLGSLSVTVADYEAIKIMQGNLKEVNFAPSRITLKPDTSYAIEMNCAADSQYFLSPNMTRLQDFADKHLKQNGFLEAGKQDGKWILLRMWDSPSFTSFATKHEGSNGGHIVSISSQSIKIGDLVYQIEKETVFIDNGKTSQKNKTFENGQMAYVWGDVKGGVPVALKIGRTSSDVTGNAASASSSRPNSVGSGKNGRPNSAGNGPLNKGNKGVKNGAVGANGANPLNQKPSKNSRPQSAGNTNNSGSSASERSTRDRYEITMYFEILDSNDDTEGMFSGYGNAMTQSAGAQDTTLECYGELKSSGKLFWEIKKKNANDHKSKKGDKINVKPTASSGLLVGGKFIFDGQFLTLKGFLYDEDNLNREDQLVAVDEKVDLRSLVGKGEQTISVMSRAKLVVKVVNARD